MAKEKQGILHQYWKHKELFLLLLPVIAYFVVFHYVPMYGVLIAFEDFLPRSGILGSEWVGLQNFQKMFSGLYFWPVFRNTLIISFLKLIVAFPMPIILALLLNEVSCGWFKKSVQTITYLPHFIGWVVLAGIVQQVLSPSTGVLNYVITALGGEPIFFMGSTKWFRPVVVLSSIWRNCGWDSIIYMAALSSVDPEQHEAATIDGASRVGRMRYIDLPTIIPTIAITLILRCGSIMNIGFDKAFLMQNDTNLVASEVISTYVYKVGLTAQGGNNFSYATAIGLFNSVVNLAIILFVNKVANKVSGSGLW